MVEYGKTSMEYGWWNDIKDFIGFEKILWQEIIDVGKKLPYKLTLETFVNL